MSGKGNADQIRKLQEIIKNFNAEQLQELFRALARVKMLPEGFPEEKIDTMEKGEFEWYLQILRPEALLHPEVQQGILSNFLTEIRNRREAGQIRITLDQIERYKAIILKFNENQLREFFRVLDRFKSLPAGFRKENIDSAQEGALKFYAGILSFHELRHPKVRQSIFVIRNQPNAGQQIQATGPLATSSAPSTATASSTERSASQSAGEPSRSVQQPKLAGVARGLGQPATEGRLIKKRKTAASGQQQQPATSTGTPETCRTPERKPTTRIDVATPSPPGQQQRPATPTGQSLVTGQRLLQPDFFQQSITAALGHQKPAQPTGPPKRRDQPFLQKLPPSQTPRQYRKILPKPEAGQPATVSPAQPTEVQQQFTKKRPASGQTATVTHAQQDQTKCRHPQILQMPALGPPATGFLPQQFQLAGVLVQPVQRQTQQFQLQTQAPLTEEELNQVKLTRQMIKDLSKYNLQDLLNDAISSGQCQIQGNIYNSTPERLQQLATDLPDRLLLRFHNKIKVFAEMNQSHQQLPAMPIGQATGTGQLQVQQPISFQLHRAAQQFQEQEQLSAEQMYRIEMTRQMIDQMNRAGLVHLFTEVLTAEQRPIQVRDVNTTDDETLRKIAKKLPERLLLSLHDRI